MIRPAPGQRGDYPLFEPVEMRWADTDIYGHMNNAVHYLMFDTAVQRFLMREGLLDLGGSPTVFFVVSSGCSYVAQITFGQLIEAGVRITRLGTTSITYEISLFTDAGSHAAATGHFTHVNLDRATRKPVPIAKAARQRFAKLM